MDGEIVIRNNNRVGEKSLTLLGLFFLGGYMGIRGWALFREDPIRAVLCSGAMAVGLFSIYSLWAGKNFLETSDDGLMIGVGIQTYIPWRNVAGFELERAERRNWSLVFHGYIYDAILVILRSLEDVYYDSVVHRLAGLLVRDRSETRLNPQMAAAVNVETLRDQLEVRWQRALGENGQEE